METGQHRRGGEDEHTRRAVIVPGHGGQHLSTVFKLLQHGTALGAHHDGGHIDHGHHKAAENTGQRRPLCHVGGVLDAEAPDDVDDHDAEGKAGQRVHGAGAVLKALKESAGANIGGGRLHR